ncbi:MAG: hypothetical protein IH877_10255 [Gemmatimonadetes bacterium]|nr:hypothetical protein [Gemmatimonadota bacterium]
MKVSGVTIVRDAVRLDFPIVEAVQSVLPLVDEMVVNVGRSADGTLQLLCETLTHRKVQIVEREWGDNRDGRVLAIETQAAFDLVQGDWVVYVQADEVLHESGVPALRSAMQECLEDRKVEGLLVNFTHHYGTPELIATARTWYRRETRVIRSGIGAESFEHAQGFRVEGGRRRIRARKTDAVFHHYGWARPAAALLEKRIVDAQIYGRTSRFSGQTVLPWQYGVRPFSGTHPAGMEQWMRSRQGTFAKVGPRRWNLEQGRLFVSDIIEKTIGTRLWEYRNYVVT